MASLNGTPVSRNPVTREVFCLDPYFDPLTSKARLEENDLDLLGIQHGHIAFHHADDIEDILDCGV